LWAEAEVRDAANRLPTIIVRPSILVGAWKFGSGGPGADPTAFMAAVRGSSRWSSSFRSSRHLGVNFVPVTYVAEAMVRIAASERSLGRTFHLTDPDPLSLEALADLEHEVLAAPALGRTLSRLERVFRRATHSRPVAWRSWVTEARYDASNSASVLGDFHPPSAAVTWSGLRTVPRAADWLLSMRAS
jgi:nucleoside-diphosphate-sugar epimerase